MKRSVLCSLFLILINLAQAQSNEIKLIESPAITRLNEYFIQYNLRRTDYPGWRIQVFASSDRREMESTLSNFRYRFPQLNSKWILNDPYYQIRAGIFLEYSEAMRSLQDIRKTFRSATLVADRIRRDEVLSL
ncbi:MAG: hypothetical protein SH818_09900 [Saprospiraceae bacterium]|nr:hypothetical protein [Saprospiraceae bacterium]